MLHAFCHFAYPQVVLIGDHRQLRPVLSNQVAKDLGMEKSLFERHSENAIMLETQYRMVRVTVITIMFYRKFG